jgi:hypothetical protein
LAWSLLIRPCAVPSSASTRAARAPRPCTLTPSGPLPPSYHELDSSLTLDLIAVQRNRRCRRSR